MGRVRCYGTGLIFGSMVRQYLDTLSWTLPGTPGGEDENGFPLPSIPGVTMTAKARYENYRGRVKEWIARDGETVVQKGTIYIKKGQPVPMKFEEVTVTREGEGVTYKGEALNVYKGQLNTTIVV